MRVITDTGELTAFCTEMRSAEYVTVDTEFMREKTFWPILCLVQVAGPDAAAAIDPLAEGLDLAPLFDLMTDETVLKVMHGGRQDVEIFYHLSKLIPAPLYDTQIAAMVCGFGEQVGYETLISKLTGGRLDKASRFTDWSMRPLSEKQLRYALDDVIYLRPAFEKLRDRITAEGRERWIDEEMAGLSDIALYDLDPSLSWRRLKPKTTNTKSLSVLREVSAWREKLAMSRDVPRNRVLRDETLSQLAAHPPADGDALNRVRGISKGFSDSRHGATLMEAVQKGIETPPDEAPDPIVKPQRLPGHGAVVELLKVLLKHKCESHHVAQKLVATTADLEEIAADDAAAVPALHGWRHEIFGVDALRLKHAELAIAAVGSRIQLVEVDGTGKATVADPGPATASSAESPSGSGNGRRRRRRRRRNGTAQTSAQTSVQAGDLTE